MRLDMTEKEVKIAVGLAAMARSASETPGEAMKSMLMASCWMCIHCKKDEAELEAMQKGMKHLIDLFLKFYMHDKKAYTLMRAAVAAMREQMEDD